MTAEAGLRRARTIRLIAVSAALIAAVAAVYARTLGHDFISAYDDGEYILQNPRVSGGLTLANVIWAFTSVHSANWHPLTWISHQIDCSLWGLDPRGHHAVSLLLHAANTVFLFLALERMTGRTGRSVFVAALFGIHPLHVESVAWIAERKDVLSTLFFLLALLAYRRHASAPSARSMTTVAVLFVLGLMAKPMLVTLPFVLLLVDAWPLGRWRPNPVGLLETIRQVLPCLREKIPLLLLSAVSSAVTFLAQREGGAVVFLDQIRFVHRVFNALVSYVAYLALAIWPRGLAYLYPHPGETIPPWKVVSAAACLVAVSGAAWRLRTSRPYFLVGWLWYLGTLVPVIGLVQVGRQAMADRYTYIPLVGIFVIAAWGIPDLLRTYGRAEVGRGLAAVAVIASVAYGAAAWRQAGYWRDNATLFERALAVTEDNALAHNNLAAARAMAGNLGSALEHYREAVRIEPGYLEAQNNLGGTLVALGRAEEGLPHIAEAIRINPEFSKARYNMGIALGRLGRLDEAEAQYREVLRIDPEYADAHYSLGVLLARRGRIADAESHYRNSLRLRPGNADAYCRLGDLLTAAGRTEEAVSAYQDALRIRPGDAYALRALETLRRPGGRSALPDAAARER